MRVESERVTNFSEALRLFGVTLADVIMEPPKYVSMLKEEYGVPVILSWPVIMSPIASILLTAASHGPVHTVAAVASCWVIVGGVSHLHRVNR